jgi:Xaa-Pro aminopeptidase
MIESHIRDGAALSKLLFWLEKNKQNKTELEVVQKLHEFRIEQNLFFSESFATIAGVGSNGAVVHYQPNEQTNRALEENQLLLLDSGGQYLDGTTDVTRTIPIGTVSDEMITDFTQVLKAHIALARSRFPQNTSGMKLDVLARAQMWQRGLDYKHGTGHGVACFGNVHEGPQSISVGGSPFGLKPNMVVSDEPGVYKENAYGIRIENLLYTRAADLPQSADFLEFTVLTKVPIDKRLINVYLLEQGELEWLNAYHQQVYKDIAPYLSGDEQRWLQKACSPL